MSILYIESDCIEWGENIHIAYINQQYYGYYYTAWPKNETCLIYWAIDRMYGFSLIMTQYRQVNWELISNNKFSNFVCLLVLVILARGDFNGIRDYKKVLLDNWLMFLLPLLLDWFIVFSILNMVTEVLILAIDTCIYFLYKWSNDNI